MTDLPPPTPAGELLRRTRELSVPKLSRSDIAHRAGIDAGTLGNIERGYRHLGGKRTVAVPGDATVIAKVAAALGITPGQLAGEGQRPDAAERLELILRTRAGAREPAPGTDLAARVAEAKEAVARLTDADGFPRSAEWRQQVYDLIDEAVRDAGEEESKRGGKGRQASGLRGTRDRGWCY